MILLPFLALLILPLNPYQADKAWKLESEKNNIKIYSHQAEEYGNNYYRAELEVNLENSAVQNLLLDYDRYDEWMKECIESKAVDSSVDSDTIMVYFRYDAPWPVKNRDVYSQVTVRQDQDDKTHIDFIATPSYKKNRKGHVRIKESSGGWVLEPNGEITKLTYFSNMKLGAGVPSFVNKKVQMKNIQSMLDQLQSIVDRKS